MEQIRLPRGVWFYDPDSPLGKQGGFGAVYAGTGENQEKVAVKQLLRTFDFVHRELEMVDMLANRSLGHVVPVLDAGQDTETGVYFIVMARAEKDLQQELDREGPFSDIEAAKILRSIAAGLAEVSDIVHRDLKPKNVLYHEGRWKVADFGIARFVEESTSRQTLKGFLSDSYAAPEQWQYDRATQATDIYALGCIAYALLTGAPPFQGQYPEDYKIQHLSVPPPSLPSNVTPLMRSLVSMMLQKLPATRPSLERVIHLLDEIISSNQQGNQGSGFSALADAGAADAEAIAKSEAEQWAKEAEQQSRVELAKFAQKSLRGLIADLFERVLKKSPTAKVLPLSPVLSPIIQLGLGQLRVSFMPDTEAIFKEMFQKSGWDVVTGATIHVIQQKTKYERSANLWYTDLGKGEEYRWWEVSYMYEGVVPDEKRDIKFQPFALIGGDRFAKADLAAAPGMEKIKLAATPQPMDGEDFEDFCERWAELLAKVSRDKPEQPRYSP